MSRLLTRAAAACLHGLYWLLDRNPGVAFTLGGVRVHLLDTYYGHPWDRVYLTTRHWHLVLSPFSKVHQWNGVEGWWGHRCGRLSLSPRNVAEIEEALRDAGFRPGPPRRPMNHDDG